MDRVTQESPSHQGDCFLCNPSHDLVFLDNQGFVALAGLGPIVEGYSLIAAKAHVTSMADIPAESHSARDAFVNLVRSRLSNQYGSCLITEHGRMGICVDNTDGLDAHCLHAHFLLFPGASDISELAGSYFGKSEAFGDLATALAQARHSEEYVLVSPSPTQVSVFSKPLNVPRQLARYLVAHDSKAMHLADWRSHPNLDKARSIAGVLRPLFQTAGATHV